MSQEVDRIVLTYLNMKGYQQAKSSLQKEANLNTAVLLSNLSKQDLELVSKATLDYVEKRFNLSLDLYKPELLKILFPLFVHCYLELVAQKCSPQGKIFYDTYYADHQLNHKHELQRLIAITDKLHLQENEFAQSFRLNKYSISICQYGFELFISFLQENDLLNLLKLVNQYLNLKVYAGNPRAMEEEDGFSTRKDEQLEKVYWGSLPHDPSMVDLVDRILKQEFMKSGHQLEDVLKVIEDMKQTLKVNVTDDSPARDRIPLPNIKKSDVMKEVQKITDIRSRVPLGPSILPSACCFTFYNTYESLNCVSFSSNSTLIAAGYSDSYIEITSLTNKKLKGLKTSAEIGLIGVDEVVDLDQFKETEGSDSKRLIGHSGPVYATDFSFDNRFLLSCSQDGTIRLWSLDLFSNVVVYKGHNYPVWDVKFSPNGHYFVSGSNDRTARLWSVETVQPLRIFAGHLSDVDCVQFHPNSNYVATGSSDKTARLWDISNGECVRIFSGHSDTIRALTFSPDGKLLATASDDRIVILWDLNTGRKVKTLDGHHGMIYTIDFSKCGNLLTSGGADSQVCIWDVKREEERITPLKIFHTKQTPVYCVQYTNKNVMLVGGAFQQ
ncbi:TFIID subunit, WD40-associated region domain-containing protein [Rozella allomycis CSF55]|uniref:TFIID subunit, WD40-associated region domain-containing protein n=1 Tax=Rozella allomycis (strain CSF55) TaxID=988480 RepID=A0A075AVB3_ROZAC|nr:TFIID subunit, WD40-associated region domain-containing protein [Rozella allomycis CSF55]|eukprot:EPZ34266.1 TFIID subunit, WD40-associated region domain-containing protein [Rozella allomycis CSF55]